MQRFDTFAVGVTRGAAVLFSDFETGGPMWTGQGPRISRHLVTFSESFVGPPVVHVGLGMWDIGQGTNLRVDISADKVTPEGFEIVFRTWEDTRIARVRAEWLAIGPVLHREFWDD